MKALFLGVTSVLIALTSPAIHSVSAQNQPVEIRDVEDFFEPLSELGVWIKVRPFGWCWYPNQVDRDWRPYVDGRWVETEDGPYWESQEPWSWATYHYGRWFYESDHGWLWVPDTQWAPAWVDWRDGEEVVGWAPLPPRAYYGGGVGVYASEPYIEPASYVFVEHHYFWEPISFGVVFFHHDHRCHRHTNCDAFHCSQQVTNIKQITKIKNSNNVQVNQSAVVNQSQVKVRGNNSRTIVQQGTAAATGQNTTAVGGRGFDARVRQQREQANRGNTRFERTVVPSTGGRGAPQRVRENNDGNRTADRRQIAPRPIEVLRPTPTPSVSGRVIRSEGKQSRFAAPVLSAPNPGNQRQTARVNEGHIARQRIAEYQQSRQPKAERVQVDSGAGRRSRGEERAERGEGGRGFRID